MFWRKTSKWPSGRAAAAVPLLQRRGRPRPQVRHFHLRRRIADIESSGTSPSRPKRPSAPCALGQRRGGRRGRPCRSGGKSIRDAGAARAWRTSRFAGDPRCGRGGGHRDRTRTRWPTSRCTTPNGTRQTPTEWIGPTARSLPWSANDEGRGAAAVDEFAPWRIGEVSMHSGWRDRSIPRPRRRPSQDSTFDSATRRLLLPRRQVRRPSGAEAPSPILHLVASTTRPSTADLDFSANALLYFRSRYGSNSLVRRLRGGLCRQTRAGTCQVAAPRLLRPLRRPAQVLQSPEPLTTAANGRRWRREHGARRCGGEKAAAEVAVAAGKSSHLLAAGGERASACRYRGRQSIMEPDERTRGQRRRAGPSYAHLTRSLPHVRLKKLIPTPRALKGSGGAGGLSSCRALRALQLPQAHAYQEAPLQRRAMQLSRGCFLNEFRPRLA